MHWYVFLQCKALAEAFARSDKPWLLKLLNLTIYLYIFFWVFPRRQIVVGRLFGTLCQFHLQRLDVDCEGKQGNLYLCQGYGLELAGPMGDIRHQVVGSSG